ncbi:MAG: ATP-binding protein [Chloroflexota bacterium]|nr:ATP-binding protein [Chloroflexota bacterium]
MTQQTIPCPVCGKPINPHAVTCPHCEANLVLAAILAKQSITQFSKEQKNIKLSPEVLVPRLGDYLIEKGFLSSEDLKKALAHQKKQDSSTDPALIGQILLDLELISREELDQAVTEQIIKLQSALQKANEELEARVKERTEELEYALSRLTELEQLKSNFLANISHELRTPLTHLKGYIQLLINEHLGTLSPQQADAIKVMQKSENKLESLIEDLIQFSILERSNFNLKIEEINLLSVLKKVIPEAQAKCQEKGIQFKSKHPQYIPYVKADAEKLLWALRHLVDNAVKFTPEGGEILVSVHVQVEEIRLSIRDTGIGIPEDKLKEIFKPFYQLDSSSTRHYGGTGLGLPLVQNIVNAHGAEVEVHSQEGEGSYFAFSLPISITDIDTSTHYPRA